MTGSEFCDLLLKHGLTYFTGVPDSTLGDLVACLSQRHGRDLTNVIACNECEAVALAAGYHMATKKLGVVYAQNAGLGKTVNPITSLADAEVFSIPMILVIGHRGELGVPDEPQHVKMGRITIPMLQLLGVEHSILPADIQDASDVVALAKQKAIDSQRPYAIVVRKGVMVKSVRNQVVSKRKNDSPVSRERAVSLVMDCCDPKTVFVSTTGMLSREVYELRRSREETHDGDFLMVGSMGCAPSIGFAIAAQHPEKAIYVLDGDGAALMQLGALATIGHYAPPNLHHILLDNGVYDSTGSQPTVSSSVSFTRIAAACGYRHIKEAATEEKFVEALGKLGTMKGPTFLQMQVAPGARADLGRPKITPKQSKEGFMKNLLK